MEKFNEIHSNAEDSGGQELGMERAIVLLITSLLLWCGSMLLFLDLANRGDNQGRVALIGSLMATIGGGWLWADFFGVTNWFVRKRSVKGHLYPAFIPEVVSCQRIAGAILDQDKSVPPVQDENGP